MSFFIYSKDECLLLPGLVLKAQSQKVLSFLGKHEDRVYDDGGQVAAVDLLPVFNEVDAFVGDSNLGFPGRKDKKSLIG